MKKSITGGYRTKVTLQYPDGVEIVDGIERAKYATGAEVYAEFDGKPPKGRQMFFGQVEHALDRRWVKIRYIVGITAEWRIKQGNTIYEIVAPPLDEGMRHRELYLECEAVKE